MKEFLRNPRTGLPAIAVFVTLVLSFAVPPFNSVVAAGSSSSMSSSSSSAVFDCDSQFSGGDIKPGDTVRGLLSLAAGCRYTGVVNVSLNGKSLDKDADQNGDVSVSVKTNTDGATAVLDDPVNVSVHQGRNDVIVSGPAVDTASGVTGTATIDAFFNLAAPVATTSPSTLPLTPVTVTPLSSSGTNSNLARTGVNLFALFLVALMAIALGTYVVAAERSLPLTVGGTGVLAPAAVGVPLFDPPLGAPETWTLELVVLTAVSYILGPPPGRHAKGGPRGLVPMLRDWIYPEK
ncbi:MAG: hypothetical protein JOZ68_00050 [Acidimicrobiia bacterium]|nr:hypothetical protein [Acidimicrobiia bacterium]